MTDLLLDYVMPLEVITPIQPANTEYIRRALVFVKPKEGYTDLNIVKECILVEDVEAITEASCGVMLQNMPRLYVVAQNNLDFNAIENPDGYEWFTCLIDPAFIESAVDGANFDDFRGVVGYANSDRSYLATFASMRNNVGFLEPSENLGENFYWAFSKMLGSQVWENQQYIEMPAGGDVDDINLAEVLFEDKVSFVLTSKQYGNRLGLFASGKRAILAPYIFEEIQVTMQGRSLMWINLNKPTYTLTNTKLLEEYLTKTIDEYVANDLITGGSVALTMLQRNWQVNGYVIIEEPTALWRVPTRVQQGTI